MLGFFLFKDELKFLIVIHFFGIEFFFHGIIIS